jgi:hypothetical protein
MSAMRIWFATIAAVLAIGVSGCTRHSENGDSAARQAGKVAYKIAQDTRQAAKKAGRQLHEASREARKGWNEAKDESRAKEQK